MENNIFNLSKNLKFKGVKETSPQVQYIQEVATHLLDRIYTPGIPEIDQCSGYKKFKDLCLSSTPITDEDLIPFHVLLRPKIRNIVSIMRDKINKNLI